MNIKLSITLIVLYLLAFLTTLSIIGVDLLQKKDMAKNGADLFFACIIIGGFGGVLYCLRGAYLNFSVRNQWSSQWTLWYLIRPIVSMICGGVSYIFLKAGLLLLEAQKEVDSTNLGFYALSFVAGMNVDKFISKIEDLAQASWGIEKSRTSKEEK